MDDDEGTPDPTGGSRLAVVALVVIMVVTIGFTVTNPSIESIVSAAFIMVIGAWGIKKNLEP